MLRISILCLIMAMCLHVYPYDKKLGNTSLLMEEAKMKLNEGDTAAALQLYSLVHAGDTNYTRSLLERINIHVARKNYEQCLQLAEKGLELPGDDEYTFLIFKGSLYAAMKKYDEALETFKYGLKKYPYNHLMIYNMALTYKEKGEYDLYVEYLKKTVHTYPFYASVHFELGNLAKNEGRTSQALMSYIMGILIEPSSDRAYGALALMDEMVSGTLEINDLPYEFPKGQDDYSEIDLIIKSQAALNKKYKVKSKADIALIRQLQAMFEKLQYDPDDQGFWMQFYVNFYKKLWKEGMFEPFSYYILRPSDIKAFQDLVKKKQKDISSFSDWGTRTIESYFDSIPLEVEGELITAKRIYQDGKFRGLAGIGKVRNNSRVGCWYYFHHTGSIEGKGCYDNAGKMTGKWLWYRPNGQLNQVYDTKDGYYHGLYQLYSEVGTIYREIEYTEGARNGSYKEYFKLGGLSIDAGYKEDKIEGLVKFYYENGQIKYQYKSVNDKLDGYFREYHENGQLKNLTKYVDGEKDSVSTDYYANGQVEDTYTYQSGVLKGPYRLYYMDGTLNKEGNYQEGNQVGAQTEHYRSGTISERENYDEEGMENGVSISYDRDGLKYLEFDYKKGNIVGYRVFNKEGKIAKEGYKKSGEFVYDALKPDGAQGTHGVYDSKGGKQGEWKFYDQNGALNEKGSYQEGKLDGWQRYYYPSGKVESQSEYQKGDWNGSYEAFYVSGKMREEGYGHNGSTTGPYFKYSVAGDTLEDLFYEDGKLHGWQYYYNTRGYLERKSWYDYGDLIMEIIVDSNGIAYDSLDYRNLTGTAKLVYPNGKPYFEGAFSNGIRNGVSKWYYGNGQLLIEGPYINGQKNGNFNRFNPDGQPENTYHYQMGTLHGEAILYHDNGQKRDVSTYHYGNELGNCTEYSEKGVVTGKYQYDYGDLHGKRYFYDPNGVVDHIRHYSYGKIIGYSYLGKDGKEVDMIPLVNETGEVKSYFSNGKPSRAYAINKGDFMGKYEEYYESGSRAEEQHYEYDRRQGSYTSYYENGQKKMELNYVDGKADGRYAYYHNNGKVKEEGIYDTGEKFGPWKYYDASGKLTTTYYYFGGYLLDEIE